MCRKCISFNTSSLFEQKMHKLLYFLTLLSKYSPVESGLHHLQTVFAIIVLSLPCIITLPSCLIAILLLSSLPKKPSLLDLLVSLLTLPARFKALPFFQIACSFHCPGTFNCNYSLRSQNSSSGFLGSYWCTVSWRIAP